MPNETNAPQQELAAYRAMQAAVQAEYDRTAEKMAALKAQGREKTATYRQLFARKLTLSEILGWYKTYGLTGPRKESEP